jgi:phospholipase C
LQSINLGDSCNPDHEHIAWKSTYDLGKMDGACSITAFGCSINQPEYSYVAASNLVPYFNIAQQYGYSNYMFQTSQGPSFPAHQFLLSGTSAPTSFSDGTPSTTQRRKNIIPATNGSRRIIPIPAKPTAALQPRPQ